MNVYVLAGPSSCGAVFGGGGGGAGGRALVPRVHAPRGLATRALV